MQDIDHLYKEAFVLINKATKKMLACGSHGEPMGLVDYGPGCDGPAVQKLILMEMVCFFFTFMLWNMLHVMLLQKLACTILFCDAVLC